MFRVDADNSGKVSKNELVTIVLFREIFCLEDIVVR